MVTSFILFLLGALCYSVRDLQSFGKLKWMEHGNYRRTFWDEDSYLRKYKLTPQSTVIKAPDNWYYRLFKIKYKERFPLSATLLVFLTDGYHLMQFLYKLLFCAAFYQLTNWWFPVVLWLLWGLVFTLCDRYLTK